MTDADLRIVIDGMKAAAKTGKPVNPIETVEADVFQLPQLNKRRVEIEGIAVALQFTVNKAPGTRSIELLCVGPDGTGVALPEGLVQKIVAMVFPEPISCTEITPEQRARMGAKVGLNPPPGFELNRQFFRIIP